MCEHVYLAALDQLLLSCLVLVGGGSMLSCSYGLGGCCCRLFSCILQPKKYTGLSTLVLYLHNSLTSQLLLYQVR